jgi:hypothetical protein
MANKPIDQVATDLPPAERRKLEIMALKIGRLMDNQKPSTTLGALMLAAAFALTTFEEGESREQATEIFFQKVRGLVRLMSGESTH